MGQQVLFFQCYIIQLQKIMINYANHSKEALSATLTPKHLYRNSQNNPLNPKNLPTKQLLINIPKDISVNNSIGTPKTARTNYREGKSASKSFLYNKSMNTTPEKMKQNKQNSYANLKKMINDKQQKQQITLSNSLTETKMKTQTNIIPKQIKDITNKEDQLKKLRQTVSNVSNFKALNQESLFKKSLNLTFSKANSPLFTETGTQETPAPISFRKKKDLEITLPSSIKIREKPPSMYVQNLKLSKESSYYETVAIKDKKIEPAILTPRTPRAPMTSSTANTTPRISQEKMRLSKKLSKNAQMNMNMISTDTTGNYYQQVNHKRISSLSAYTPRKQKEREREEIKLEDFDLGSCKGEGRFGKVYPARHKKSGFLLAIKQIKKESVRLMLEQFTQQIKINMFLDHPNVTKTYGFFHDKSYFYILMEYMEQGSLYKLIKMNKKLSQQQTKSKLYEICSAVKYLHENEILHRDIKPQNIVLTNGVCKLCDFGWAVYSNERRNTYCGTLDYVCPEILQGQSYDKFVDIWAVGVLAFEMLIGKAPFYHISRQETMKSIMKCNINFPIEMSERAKTFIQKALQKNADNRLQVQYLLKDVFLKNQGFTV